MKKDLKMILTGGIIGMLFLAFPVLFESYLHKSVAEFYLNYRSVMMVTNMMVIIASARRLLKLGKESKSQVETMQDKPHE